MPQNFHDERAKDFLGFSPHFLRPETLILTSN